MSKDYDDVTLHKVGRPYGKGSNPSGGVSIELACPRLTTLESFVKDRVGPHAVRNIRRRGNEYYLTIPLRNTRQTRGGPVDAGPNSDATMLAFTGMLLRGPE